MKALVLANGPLGDPPPRPEWLEGQGLVVAADGGARHAEPLGLDIDVVVGDLDSIPSALLARLEARAVEIRRFPARKDEIDLELALLEARARGAREALVLGGLGARWDQTLANVLLAASPALGGLAVRFVEGNQSVRALTGPDELEIDEPRETVVSLLPLAGAARGITSEGLEYPLRGDTLPFGTPRGVSNVVTERPARIRVEEGTLCVVVVARGRLAPRSEGLRRSGA